MGMMDDAVPDRYEHNPMLAIVENFVLDAIGQLDAESAAKLSAIVCKTFGGTDWRKVIRDQFGLPPDTEKQLRAAWKQRQEEADAQQDDVSPEEFAQDAADNIVADTGS